MSDYTHTPIGSGYNTNSQINTEFSGIETAVNSKVDKSGATMTGSLDMNSQRVLNLPSPLTAKEPVTFDMLSTLVANPDATVHFTDSVSVMVGLEGVSVGDVVQTAEFSTGNGGGGTYDCVTVGITANVDLPNTYNIIVSTVDAAKCFVLREQSEYTLAQLTGAGPDGSTDRTADVINAITVCHELGSGTLGSNWVGSTLRIPSNTVWDFNAINQSYNGTVSSTASSLVATLSGSPAFTDDELVGAFLWNTTDFSYGTITTNTADTVTVANLRLGATNTFSISDGVIISKYKVGVTIIDDSKYDPHNSRFTGQRRVYVNADGVSQTAGNEQHIVGQYHPAYIVSNINSSPMEKRASFLARNYNPETGELETSFQIGINPINDTGDVVEDVDFLITSGHDIGAGLYTKQIMGWRTQDSNSVNLGFGVRADEDYFAKFQNDRNALCRYNFDAQGTQHTDWEFSNGNANHDTWRIYSTGGTTGQRRAITDTVGNLSVTADMDSTRIYTNDGAVGGRTITLPDSTASNIIGMEVALVVTVAQTFAVDPLTASGDQILGTTGAEANVSSSTIGNSITVTCISDGFWAVTAINGTWTFS